MKISTIERMKNNHLIRNRRWRMKNGRRKFLSERMDKFERGNPAPLFCADGIVPMWNSLAA